jgi:hypothetical protein
MQQRGKGERSGCVRGAAQKCAPVPESVPERMHGSVFTS